VCLHYRNPPPILDIDMHTSTTLEHYDVDTMLARQSTQAQYGCPFGRPSMRLSSHLYQFDQQLLELL
jgi:hypothetical protein